ncbi:MAG TPA: efflux RND transporter periplasmic adaptor subunit [Gemmataceae bacterium]|nr:efflux RND transporter periplasmic adaptor subunit [Gemmataceae bacterium]
MQTGTRHELGGSSIIEGIGYVEPASELRHLSPKTGSVVKACYVKVGDVVRKGDTILTLHDEKEIAAVALARKKLLVVRAEEAQTKNGINRYRILAAETTVARFQAEYKYAAQEADRMRALYARRWTSQSDMESAEARRFKLQACLRQAEAQLLHLKNYVREVDEALMKAKVSQAEANLELAEQQLRDLRVLAPFDGTILKLLKRPGEGVRRIELEPVVIFGDLSRLRVRAEIDERFVNDLKVGQRAEVYGRNLRGKTYLGRLIEVEKIMGDKTVFAKSAAERNDLNVLQVVVAMPPGFSAPVGLQVDVRIHRGTQEKRTITNQRQGRANRQFAGE